MARFLVAMMTAVVVVACSPGASENESCKLTPDCQAALVCLFNPGVCKRTCLTDAQCGDGQICQCSGPSRHCDKALPDGGAADAGCGG